MRGQRLRRCLQIPPLAAFHNIRTRIPSKSFRNHKGLTVIIVRRSPFKSLYLAIVRVRVWYERDEEGKSEISGVQTRDLVSSAAFAPSFYLSL